VTDLESIADEVAKSLAPVLETEALVRLAYLYGSALYLLGPEDVDIAVWAPDTTGMSPSDRERWLGDLGRRLERCLAPRRDLDLRLLNGASVQFQYAVVRTGRLLLARSEVERVRFEAAAASLALDLSIGLRAYDRAMLAAIP